MARIGWLIVVLVLIVCLLGCWSGRKTGSGSNTNVGRGSDYDGPWNGGGGSPALTGP